ncbi:universal stress protein [Paraburkholderia diazotrophica]|uniref:Nucleotide-binding universal stress protein, UspA family n=1 Tax=Paraburkholderia diazotrophica TaxID=667676 RepID=A0A1H7EGT3_9BURK|nr:universal stress protein [Paraburkholderia diazotrophica]SEK10820.1 Nucleotide-binding universal stress protein, UspA family [Paraburkholderia diazotrophica]
MNGKSTSSAPAVAFKRVIVASEGGAGLVPLTRFALRLAAPDAFVRLTEVVCNPAALCPRLLMSYPDWREAHRAMQHEASTRLTLAARQAAAFVAKPETDLIDLAAMHWQATEALSRSAREWHADLIAVASHPRSHRWACRLNPEELVAMSHCPVLHVPFAHVCTKDAGVTRVLVAVDRSPPSLTALHIAASVVPKGTVFRLVYVLDRPAWLGELLPRDRFGLDGEQTLRQARKLIRGTSKTVELAVVETETLSDDIASTVLHEAKRWQADLLVMSTSSKPKFVHPLPGHVVAQTLRDAECPVLVCPSTIEATANVAHHNQRPLQSASRGAVSASGVL